MLDMGDRGQHLRNGHRGLTRCRFAKGKESSASESSEERTDHGGQSNFGKLLMTLEPGHESFANRHKRQREEQVMSDSDDEDDSDTDDEDDSGTYEHEKNSLQSFDVSGEVDGEAVDFVKQNVEDVKDEDEASDDENSLDLEMNDKTDFYTSENTSSLKVHFGHTLDESEIDNLAKRKLKFKWQVPAAGISMSKWAGTGKCPLKVDDRCSGYGLKQKVYMHWLGVFGTSSNDFHSSNRRQFFSLCNSYCDILHGNKKPFYLNGKADDLNVTDAYIMHTLNHIYKTRDLVNRNNEKLAKQLQNSEESSQTTDELLDQGFTRPKVLILLPLRSIALKVVKRLIELTPPSLKVNVEHMDRLFDEFGSEEEDEEYTKVHDNENAKSHKSSKPVDFQALFGGNNDDHFLVGIKFTRKSIRLYSDFYSSDMIIASPFGLITKIGEAESDKEKDVDYLSSIEVLIIDHADVITMQNWSHVNTVVEQLNRIPSKQHGTDIMRIRKWYLDGNARFYRQTILLGGFVNPGMNALFNHLCVNYEGKVKLISKHKGVLPKVLLQVRQVYDRLDSASTDVDAIRFNYFSNKVFPKIKDSDQGGIMLFISSYFEFVRIRNFLKSQNTSFCTISEYTKQKDISRQRNWFLDGRRKIMLYTERAHFYFRYKIRGIKTLIIYSLPERKEFYPEIVNMLSLPKKDNTLEGNDGMTCTVLFSRCDFLRLERIVGTPAANKMLISKKNTFVFC